MSTPPITAYLRISTEQQDHASQRQQIDTYAAANGLIVTDYIHDNESGSTPWQQRQIGRLLRELPTGSTILVSEISRVARSVVGVLTAFQFAIERGITVIAARSNLRLDGSLPAKIVITMLALAAEIERDLIRDRTKAALQARKARGLPFGRQIGAFGTSCLHNRGAEIDRALAAKISKRGIARLLNVSPQTLYTYLANRDNEGA